MQESFAEIPSSRAEELLKMFRFLGSRKGYECDVRYECDYMVKKWVLKLVNEDKALAELAVFEPRNVWSFKERQLAL